MSNELDFSVLDPANAVLTLRGDLKITPGEFDGEACYMIEDPLRGKFFRIGSDEFALISLLDGKNTISQAIGLSAEALQERAFVENEAMSVCHWLLESQLAYCGGGGQGERLATSARKLARTKLAAAINPLSMRLPLWNPTAALNRIAPYTEWIFTRPAIVGWCVICSIGFLIALSNRTELIESSSVLLDRDNWLKLALAWLVLKLLHEAGHAITCLHFGGNVPSAGVLLVLFTPLPFVDVTASWRFPTKWQRIATGFAGIYVELFLAALAIILWSWSDSSVVRHAALNVAATASFGSVVVNGNPLMRFDGYYMLSDWLELPNLSASGQKFLAGIFQRLLDIDVPSDNRSPKAQRIIAIYAISALFWRILVYAGLLLMLYAMVLKLGAFLAGIAVFLALTAMLVMPVQRIVKYLLNQPALSRQRLAIVGASGVVCIFIFAFILTRPSTVRAWGVVDYSPPTIVRSISPGFVREVKVHDGEKVASGDVLIVMENDELQQQLADLRVDIEQSVLQERMLRQNQENAKAQAEMAKCRSLKQKEAEVLRLVEGLTVRAPSEGKVVAHDLDSMVGRYLSVGDEIVVIGNEESKEVVVAAAQDDINSFTSQLYMPVTVRVSGDESNSFTASLGRVDPRASLRIPHPALGADAGGALPVKPKKQKADAKAPDSELLDPHFSATISLFSTQSLRLHAGQRAMVLFSSSEQSWAGRLVLRLRKWIDDRLASTQRAS